MLPFFNRFARYLLLAGLLLAPLSPPAMARALPRHGAAPAAIAAPHPALWRLRFGASTIYLFGTVHLMSAEADWFAPPVARAFAASDTLVTEIIEPAPQEMARLLLARATLPQGQSLRALLPAKTRATYEQALAGIHLPPAALDRFQPAFGAVSLVTLSLKQAGFAPDNGVDAQLAARADAAHKAREALETVDFQLGLFASLPMDKQQAYLAEVLDNLPKLPTDMRDVVAAWKAGRVARLARLINDDTDDPALKQALLINRNKAWAQWLKARRLQPGTVFVAVGAGHLAGPGSVIDQLAALGIRAERLP